MNRGISISARRGAYRLNMIILLPLQSQQQQQQVPMVQQVPMLQQETYATMHYSNHSNPSHVNKTAVSVQVPMNFDRKIGNQMQVIII